MKSSEDFVIATPYQLIPADSASIAQASPNDYNHKDWENDCLDDFKDRLREDYYDKQHLRCAYCRMELRPESYTPEIDHIIPKSKKPKWMYEPFNLCVTCKACNTKKGQKKVLKDDNVEDLPMESDAYVIVHPHIDRYSEHIQLVDGILYQGISKKGKETVKKCKLFRFELAAQRASELIIHGQLSYTKFMMAMVDEGHRRLTDKYEMIEKRVQQIIKRYKQDMMQ